MQASGKVAEAHGVRIAHQRTHASAATVCADWLQEALASAIARAGVKPHYLASGAGHDAAAMAALCPVGMLFVRCRGGISHHPDEHVSLQDASVAIEVLADTLRHLCAQEMSS
jgi:allantoate deiminase